MFGIALFIDADIFGGKQAALTVVVHELSARKTENVWKMRFTSSHPFLFQLLLFADGTREKASLAIAVLANLLVWGR